MDLTLFHIHSQCQCRHTGSTLFDFVDVLCWCLRWKESLVARSCRTLIAVDTIFEEYELQIDVATSSYLFPLRRYPHNPPIHLQSLWPYWKSHYNTTILSFIPVYLPQTPTGFYRAFFKCWLKLISINHNVTITPPTHSLSPAHTPLPCTL